MTAVSYRRREARYLFLGKLAVEILYHKGLRVS